MVHYLGKKGELFEFDLMKTLGCRPKSESRWRADQRGQERSATTAISERADGDRLEAAGRAGRPAGRGQSIDVTRRPGRGQRG